MKNLTELQLTSVNASNKQSIVKQVDENAKSFI